MTNPVKFKRSQEVVALKNLIWRTPFFLLPGASASVDISDYSEGGVEVRGRAPINQLSLNITEPDGQKYLFKVECETGTTQVVLDQRTLVPQGSHSKVFNGFIADSQLLAGLNCHVPEHDHTYSHLMALGYVKGKRRIYRFSLMQLIMDRLDRLRS